jgi:prevent-host-death family protein
MAEFDVHEAASRLSELIDRALAGEDVVIVREGEPLVRLVPVVREPNVDHIR